MGKTDPTTHVILDANVLVTALSPKLHNNPEVVLRSKALLNAVVDNGWLPLRLHVPSICLAEAQCVLDKFRHCEWSGPVFRNPSLRLTSREYNQASLKLAAIAHSRQIHRLEISHDHLRIVPLVSVVNQKYQYRRRRRSSVGLATAPRQVAQPMGAMDCVIAALAIEMAAKIDCDSVILVTADRRLADIMDKCRRLPERKARSLSLPATAHAAGFRWHSGIYPRCINLARTNDIELADVFSGWPLPARPVQPRILSDLTDTERRLLFNMNQEQQATSGVGPDSLPFSPELDRLQVAFAQRTGIYLRKAEIARQLLAWRKNPTSRPL